MYEANGKVFGEGFGNIIEFGYRNGHLESWYVPSPDAELQDLIAQDIVALDEFGNIRILKFEEMMQRMGITDKTSAKYQAYYSKWIDSQITTMDEENVDKQMEKQFS
jgi:hypothetical protein